MRGGSVDTLAGGLFGLAFQASNFAAVINFLETQGISLSVTPQIDEDGRITLHIHPQVSTVRERAKLLKTERRGAR